MRKTDYLGIHEKAYKRIMEEGRAGWSENHSLQAMVEVIIMGFNEHGIRSGKILELGCGDGNVSLEMESRGFEVSGIDIVPMAIELANRKAMGQKAKVDFQVGDVTCLPFADQIFDAVIDASCSHCIIGEDRIQFFAEAYRVLKSEGLFILNCLCDDPPANLQPSFDRESRCLIKGDIAGRYYGKVDEILKETEEAGFINQTWATEENDHGDIELVLYSKKQGNDEEKFRKPTPEPDARQVMGGGYRDKLQ